MTSQIQNNNNLEDMPDVKNDKRFSTDSAGSIKISQMKKTKKKKKLGLFSFRSRRTKVTNGGNAEIVQEQSDSVSVCSEMSTTEDSAYTVETTWSETHMVEASLSQQETRSLRAAPDHNNTSTNSDEEKKVENANGKLPEQVESGSPVDLASSAAANEDESTITIVTPLSEDGGESKTALSEQQSPGSEILIEQKLVVTKDLTQEKENKKDTTEAICGKPTDPRLQSLLGVPNRPNSIHLKNSSSSKKYADATWPQKDLSKRRQRALADYQSSSTDCTSVSPIRRIKSKKVKKMPVNSDATHRLRVRLLSGENLVARDANGKSDPYVKFKIHGRTVYKSRICKANLFPKWMENFTVPVKKDDDLIVRVFDHDIGIRDDFMGASKIELEDVLEGEEIEIKLPLEDENAGENDLGSLHIAITMEPFLDEVDFANAESQSPDDYDTMSIASSRFASERCSFSRSDSIASDISRRTTMSITSDMRSRKMTKTSIATVTIQLVSGKGLPARDSNGLSDPYVKLQLGKQRHRSKVCYKTLEPVWKEEFVFQLSGRESLDRETAPLDITVWDKDSYRKDDFIGRCELDLWPLENDKTNSFTLNLVDAPGSLMLLVTRHSSVPVDTPTSNTHLSHLREQFSLLSSFSNLSDVGFAEVKILRANGCRAADIGGKSDPFCVVELCNQRAQTHTCYKTLDPVWNKTVTFPIKDIHDVLKFTVYDEDKDGEMDFLGKVSIPLLRAKSGEEKTYALKDRKLLNKSKGTITLQITFIYNKVRAAIRTFSPREEKFMEQDVKFKRQLLLRNFHRVWNCLQAVVQTLEFVNSCFTWQNPVRSATAFIVYLLIIWNIELYMLPILLLLLLLKNYVAVVVQKTKVDRRMVDSPDEEFNDDDDDDNEDAGNRLSLIQRLNAIQEVLLKVQNILDWIACLLERIRNTFTWSVPFLSSLAVIVLCIVCIVLYFISFRTIAILWGINKFTKRLRKPNFIPNNELLDFLSRIPSEVELDEYQELSLLHGSPKNSKKKK